MSTPAKKIEAAPAEVTTMAEASSAAVLGKDMVKGAVKGAVAGAVKGAMTGALEGALDEVNKAAIRADEAKLEQAAEAEGK